MLFGLVINNEIQVGPRLWSWSIFYDYLKDEELDTTALPRVSPEAAIITDQWKILPANNPHINILYIDEPYQQYAGPFWTIYEDHIEGEYTVAEVPIDTIKGALKGTISNSRYKVENRPITVSITNGSVRVDTSKSNRNQYLLKSLELTDGEIVSWKYFDGWLDTSKEDFLTIVNAIKVHVQSCFDWEKDKHYLVDIYNTIEDLKTIELKHPNDDLME